MTHDASAILANPTEYGFEFTSGTVSKGGQGDKAEATYTVPSVRVTDVTKFEAAFPGLILKALDGQSIKVGSQRITRDACDAIPALERQPEVLKARLIAWLLGIRTTSPRTVTVFAGPEGKTYATQELAAQAWKSWAQAQ